MKKPLLVSTAFLAVAGAVLLAHGQALAAPPENLDAEKAQLRKENADLRELLRMRDENAALRRRLGEKGIEAPAPLAVVPAQRLQAALPAEPSGVRPEPSAGRVKRSVFESYAADLPVKAAPVRTAIYDWTGFYVGGNIGYSVGHDRAGQTLTLPGIVAAPFIDSAVAPRGAVGGVQLGYNWQGGRNWLVGFEADFQAANQIDKACAAQGCDRASGGNETTISVEHKVEYFGTLRARLGAAVDTVLFYATGGAAYGRVLETAGVTVNAPALAGVSVANVTAENRFGWAAGGGIEAALWGNWTAKAEYLYLNLGDIKPNSVAFVVGPTPFILTTTGIVRDHIVRAGVNYRFGDAPLNAYASAGSMEAYAAYAPAYSWTGFYLGANAGYSAGVSRLSQQNTSGGLSAQSTVDSVITPKGFAGGGQIGYNWQGGRNWLVGFEADIQGTNQNDTSCTPTSCITVTTAAGTVNSAITAQQQLDWFGTLRGRIGAVNNNILFYATGGAAFGQVKQTISDNVTAPGSTNFSSSAGSFNLVGWAAGGGIEAAVAGNWTAKAEYLYLDLGTINSPFSDGTLTISNTSTVRDHIFRAGVNYRFSGMPDRSWQ
jgi:outer membrane immunogenic protein